MSERKLLTKDDLREDNRPTGPIDAALKAPVGSGFLKLGCIRRYEAVWRQEKSKSTRRFMV